jgi:Flp pilus assembly protein CpaB
LNRRITTGIIIALAGLIVAALGVYAIRQIITQALAPPPLPTPLAPATEKVVAVSHDVPIGALLDTEDLKMVDMPVELVPRNALNDELEVIGRITKVALVDGELVLRHHLADPTNVSHDLAFVIEEDQVLMAFPAGDLMSDLDVLQRGDRVDILVSIKEEVATTELNAQGEEVTSLGQQGEEEPLTRLFTFDAMQAIEISAIVADIKYAETRQTSISATGEGISLAQPTPQPTEINVRAYLLAMSPQDALLLKHLLDLGGEFDIVLRSSAPPIYFELVPVTEEYIVERYDLKIIK